MDERIITIGRQFGSGGREIGQKLAKALDIAYYDKELLLVAAKESGLSTHFLESQDEKRMSSLLFSLVMGQPNMVLSSFGGTTVEMLASQAQRDAVLRVAEEGSCVIVGRAADYILEGRPGLVKVFITADESCRIARVAARDQLSEKDAGDKIRRMDRSRKSYYDFYTSRQWGEAANYDLCLNATRLGIDGAVELILRYLDQLAQ